VSAPTVARSPVSAAPLPAVDTLVVEGDLRGGLTVRAGKTVTVRDPYLAGHFPAVTVYPGVFTLETLRQAVVAAVGTCAGEPAELHLLRSARFVAPLLDGDELIVVARIGPVQDDDVFEVTARCERGDGVLVAQVRAQFRWGVGDGA
jgi:3-hydroxyacyl-[acyl-carrier-protein] dehydratase